MDRNAATYAQRHLAVLLDLITDGSSHVDARAAVARVCERHGIDAKEDPWVSLHVRGWRSNMVPETWSRWRTDRQGWVDRLAYQAKAELRDLARAAGLEV